MSLTNQVLDNPSVSSSLLFNLIIMYTDLSYLQGITKNNHEVILMTIEKFSVNMAETMKKMDSALLEEDWGKIGAEAHKLLSSVGILGIKDMEGPVRNLESYCKEGINLDKVPSLVEDVKDISHKVLLELDDIKKSEIESSHSSK